MELHRVEAALLVGHRGNRAARGVAHQLEARGQVQHLVDPRLAQELGCYPLGRQRNILTVAMLNPRDRLALERLHQETGMDIFPILTHPQELQTALEQLV